MPFKTVQTLAPTYPLDKTPGLDRLAHPDEITRTLLIDLVNRGELPRYRGDEVEFGISDTELTITMQWNSRAVAQEYADFCTANTVADFFKSVEVIEY